MKLALSETLKMSAIPVPPIMSLFNQFSTRSLEEKKPVPAWNTIFYQEEKHTTELQVTYCPPNLDRKKALSATIDPAFVTGAQYT